ncbi:hypothetical protein ABZ787_07060, partial [Micrococcus luteus]|uniref:hypothetical protein n=1 Tax=Micrococcus luteus TaxID=1270 RepID=UPI00340A9851
TAGEHFTPRDAVKLLVDLLTANDDDVLTGYPPGLDGQTAQTNRGAARPARTAPTSGPTIGTQA